MAMGESQNDGEKNRQRKRLDRSLNFFLADLSPCCFGFPLPPLTAPVFSEDGHKANTVYNNILFVFPGNYPNNQSELFYG